MTFAVINSALFALLVCSSLSAFSQAPSTQVPTFRVGTHLVLVDVVAEYTKNKLRARALLTDLRRQDFRIFDNGREMPIQSFDIGAQHETRPIALWVIVQCDNIGSPPEWHSGFLRGKVQFLKPALAHLEKDDVLGVAHWCDDGTASLDLQPGHDPDAALALANRLISGPAIQGEDRPGQLAMQKMIGMILDNVRQTKPERLPIFLFLYGDHAGTFKDEANLVIKQVLETSGIVFGMNDNSYPFDIERMFRNGEVSYLVHYYSHETGGQFYSTVDPKLFSDALDYILHQLHLRYTIGFKALVVDGKRHALKVELTKDAAKRFPGAELRFRQEYVPIAAP